MASEQQNDSRRYGHALARYLTAGGALQPVAGGAALLPGEQCFGISHAELLDRGGRPPGVWSPVDTGRVHVTEVRLLFDGRSTRLDLPLTAIAAVTAGDERLELDTADGRRIGMVLPYPDYWHVLLTRLTTGAILQPRAVEE